MGVKILTDSACDLSPEVIEEYKIDVLPIIVLQDDVEYFDRIDIQAEEVYDNMRKGYSYTTAQIPPIAFNEKFKEYAENNDSVIYISFSSRLSGIYNTSILIRESVLEEYPGFDLDIVDTKAASGGFGLMVLQAAKLAKEGKSKDEILKTIEFYKENMVSIFTVDNIEYLFRGGRVTRSQAFVGGLLNIKPVLHIEDGRLIPLDKVRGRNKALKYLMDLIEEKAKGDSLAKQTIGITHGDDLETALKVKEAIEERFGTKDFIINIIGATIGAHVGPGTLAIFFLKDLQ